MFSLLRRQRTLCLLLLVFVIIASSGLYGLAAQAPQVTVFTVTNAQDSGTGSLRQAILDANANSGDDNISFNIPGSGPQAIALVTPLPAITEKVVINGLTQPGADCEAWPPTLKIVLNGAQISDNDADGLVITSSASLTTIRGLVIQNFPDNGIAGGGIASFTVDCNFIGTDVTGQTAAPNGWDGVAFSDLSSHTTEITRNVISGNAQSGIYSNWRSIIEDNYIGTNVTGTAPLGNGNWGILLGGEGLDNIVRNNVIAYNGGDGIYVANGVFLYEFGPNTGIGNLISRNRIFDNGKLGIDLHGKDDPAGGGTVTLNDPGDADAEEANPYEAVSGGNRLQNFPVLLGVSRLAQTVSGSFNSLAYANYGLEFFINPTCDASGYGEGRDFIGDTMVTTDGNGNAIFNSLVTGELPEGYFVTATATDIFNNTSEFSQCLEIPQDNDVIMVINTDDGGIGSLREAILTANALEGFNIVNFNIPWDGPHVITLLSPLPEITDPVDLNGLTQPGSTCEEPQIKLYSGGDFEASGLVINAGNSTVQGLTITNVLGEYSAGVKITGGKGKNKLYCNQILLNGWDGIRIMPGSNRNFVGGPGKGNLIQSNGQSGIWADSIDNKVVDNQIEQNGAWGIILDADANKNLIRANVIRQNVQDGIFVNRGKFNALERNIIYDNGGLGIDLYDRRHKKDNVPLPNDPGDTDDGSNALQNHPILTQAVGGTHVVKAKLESTPSTTFTIDVFLNSVCDPSGYGEGELWVGSQTVDTNASGLANFSLTLDGTMEPGQYITATVRDAAGNTSEFSPCYLVREMVELVVNGDFEQDLNGWSQQKLDGDKIVCSNVAAHEGDCAFRFYGYPGGSKGKIWQDLDVSKVDPGENLRFEFWLARGTAIAGTRLATFKVTYTDSTTEQFTFDVPSVTQGLQYRKLSKSLKVTKSIAQLQISLQYPQIFGRLYVDDVSVKLYDMGVDETGTGEPLVPLPSAPDGVPDGIRSIN